MATNNTTLMAVIDDGTREVTLVNTFGKEICKVYFRPADLSFLDRYKALVDGFEEIVKPLESLDIKSDGSAAFERDWPVLKQVETDLKNRINALFDMEEADLIFASRSPFSSVHGQFFALRVLEALGGVIQTAMTEEVKASEQRVNKYLQDKPPAQAKALPKPPAKKRAAPKKNSAKKG